MTQSNLPAPPPPGYYVGPAPIRSSGFVANRQLFWGVLFIVSLFVMAFISLIGGAILCIIFLVLEFREMRLARKRARMAISPAATAPVYGATAPPPPAPTALGAPSNSVPVGAVWGGTAPIAAVPPPPPTANVTAVPYCTGCGRPTTFIPQYGRYYCYGCYRYA